MKVFLCLLVASIAGLVACNDAHISYTTLSGTADPVHTVNWTIGLGAGTTFHDVMKTQAWFDEENFEFETIDSDYGKVVTSIGGLANDYNEKVAWQLFILPEYPTEWGTIPDDSLRANKAVDKIEIEDNQHFLFIYLEYKEK
ncbi:uncharacterized protein [Atheta coriaria]|uniref:uncharacterized protein n=1 Tax=Dalotia coriaria TaxID=877792 RepID=UPI0031F44945